MLQRRGVAFVDFAQIGLKGRRTGLEIKNNLPRDENGLEDINAYFSPGSSFLDKEFAIELDDSDMSIVSKVKENGGSDNGELDGMDISVTNDPANVLERSTEDASISNDSPNVLKRSIENVSNLPIKRREISKSRLSQEITLPLESIPDDVDNSLTKSPAFTPIIKSKQYQPLGTPSTIRKRKPVVIPNEDFIQERSIDAAYESDTELSTDHVEQLPNDIFISKPNRHSDKFKSKLLFGGSNQTDFNIDDSSNDSLEKNKLANSPVKSQPEERVGDDPEHEHNKPQPQPSPIEDIPFVEDYDDGDGGVNDYEDAPEELVVDQVVEDNNSVIRDNKSDDEIEVTTIIDHRDDSVEQVEGISDDEQESIFVDDHDESTINPVDNLYDSPAPEVDVNNSPENSSHESDVDNHPESPIDDFDANDNENISHKVNNESLYIDDYDDSSIINTQSANTTQVSEYLDDDDELGSDDDTQFIPANLTRPSSEPKTPQLRRSSRVRVAPLKFWKNERILFNFDHQLDAPKIKEIYYVSTPVATKEKKKPVSKKNQLKKRDANDKIKDKENDDIDDHLQVNPNPDPPFDQPPRIEIEINDYHEEKKSRRIVAWSPTAPEFQQAKNSSFSLATLFDKDSAFTAGGIMSIQVGGMKPLKSSKHNSYIFYIISGNVEVTIAESTFKLSQGSSFEVPRGNYYSVTNISNSEVKLFFVQGTDTLDNDSRR